MPATIGFAALKEQREAEVKSMKVTLAVEQTKARQLQSKLSEAFTSEEKLSEKCSKQ